MRVKYVGVIDEVEIAETGQAVKRGEIVEVSDDLGTRLCYGADWQQTDVGPLEQRTKDDLLAEAGRLGIEGRWDMNKDELIAAIEQEN